jgi:hypothetical protein
LNVPFERRASGPLVTAGGTADPMGNSSGGKTSM